MINLISRSLFQSAALALLLAAGCSNNPSVESFTPPKDAARDALTAALDAWQSGQAKPGEIEDVTPTVQMNDPRWAKGAKLKSYEIVEELPGDSPRKFSVKLTLEGEAAPAEITYVVVGKQPLWVMPQEEYDRGAGM